MIRSLLSLLRILGWISSPFILFFFCLFPAYAGTSSADSPDYLFPALEVFGTNMFVWSIDRYVTDQEWARISFDSIKSNIEHGFVWDSDGFEMNQLFHPYSGALSFTAARSSGLSFYQSLIYPFAGSLMWELAMENEYPSINDIVTTPMSGIVLGEISYRISNLIFYSGKRNFWRTAASSTLSPMSGFNRLTGEYKSFRNNARKIVPYTVRLSAGVNGVFEEDDFSQRLPHLYLNYNMEYGSYSDLGDGYQPFDYFRTDAGVSFSDTHSIITVFASGLVLGKYMYESADSSGIVGVFKSFNFLDSRAYKISASSIGTGCIFDYTFGNAGEWKNLVLLSAIVMGGIDSPYALETGRDYNLGPGMSGKVESSLTLSPLWKVYARYKYYWLYPISGAKGNECVDIFTLGNRVNITNQQTLTVEFTRYDRWSYYDDYPDLRDNNFAFRLYYTIRFQHKTKR